MPSRQPLWPITEGKEFDPITDQALDYFELRARRGVLSIDMVLHLVAEVRRLRKERPHA